MTLRPKTPSSVHATLFAGLALSFVLLFGAWLTGCVEVSAPLDRADADASDGGDTTSPDMSEFDVRDMSDTARPDMADGTMDAADVGPDAMDAMDTTEMPPPFGEPQVVYPTDQTHSPLTPEVIASIAAIRDRDAQRNGGAVAKVGDSITVSSWFLHCFDGAQVDLDGRPLDTTVAAFMGSWSRDSLVATGGWSALSALAGAPSPLQQEIDALNPRYAVVMYGTNDIQRADIDGYAEDMLDIVDVLTGEGVVPILSSIPPRDDSATADAEVPHYNAIVRAIAEQRAVPFMDYHRELAAIAGHGLAGDGVHPDVFVSGSARACVLTAAGLQHGYNVRNLLAVEALDRTKAAVENTASADPASPRLLGDGTTKGPFVIDRLPFSDLRDTRDGMLRNIDTYTGCAASQDESGPEVYYRLELLAPTRIRASVFDRGDVDIDIHLLDDTMTAAGCIDRAHRWVEADLAAGTYHLVLDTFVSSSGEQSGEYLLVVTEAP